MGRRFEEFKSRMRSEAQIAEIENDVAENEAFLTANPDAPAGPLRMLRTAVTAMKNNLGDLRQIHKSRFGRRFAK